MAVRQCVEDFFRHMAQALNQLVPVELASGFDGGVVLFASQHLSNRLGFVPRLQSRQPFVQRVDVTAATQLGSRVQWIGLMKPSAPATNAQRLQSVIRHVSSTDPLAGTFGALDYAECHHHAILEQLPWIVGADLRDRAGDASFEAGLDFFEEHIFG